MPRTIIKNHLGFTLVELLIGLCILGLILLLTLTSLHTVGKSSSVAEIKSEQTDEFRLAGNFLRQRLAQTVPLLWIKQGEKKLAFQGEKQALHFIAPLPAHRGGGGLYQLTLEKREKEGSSNLVLTYRLALPGLQTFESKSDDHADSTILMEHVKYVEFAYYGRPKRDDEPRWQDDWIDAEELPELIAITLQPTNHGDVWPVLTVTVYPHFIPGHPELYQILEPQSGMN